MRCRAECCAGGEQAIGEHYVPVRARKMTMIGTTADAPAITRSMLDLCSAPSKALRFASTALARGLRALTVPARRSPSGNCAMAGSATTLQGAFDRILIVDVPFERR